MTILRVKLYPLWLIFIDINLNETNVKSIMMVDCCTNKIAVPILNLLIKFNISYYLNVEISGTDRKITISRLQSLSTAST